MDFLYLEQITRIVKEIKDNEVDNIESAVQLLKRKIKNKNNIYVFGSSHAGILTQELFYRAGGLMNINPIFARETMLDTEPITRTSKMERLEGYGKILADEVGFKENDLLIIHSVSGRNPQTIDIAEVAKDCGAEIICITNLDYSKSVESRHSSGKKLYDFADIILDNHGDIGDASIEVEALNTKISPTSSIISIYYMHEIITQSVIELTKEGFLDIPVFYSSNLDGGDEKNRRLFEEYSDNIKYKMY